MLEDLCAFVNDDALPAVAQAAIAHAQFETIHPFVDGNGRTGRAAVELLIGALPGAPVLSVSSAASLIGRSFQATNEAMIRLEAAGVVHRVNVGRRNRAFEAPAIIDAFTALERQLAGPAGDTRTAPPDRPAPARPQAASPRNKAEVLHRSPERDRTGGSEPVSEP